jgi:hypothetical protein
MAEASKDQRTPGEAAVNDLIDVLKGIDGRPKVEADKMKARLARMLGKSWYEIDADLLSEKGKIVRGYSIDAWKAYMRVLQPQDGDFVRRVIDHIEKGSFHHFEAVFLGRFEDEATFRLSAQYDDEDEWVQSKGHYFCAVPERSYDNSTFWEIEPV